MMMLVLSSFHLFWVWIWIKKAGNLGEKWLIESKQCNAPSGNSSVRYTTMSNALKASGREIYYAMCSWGVDAVWEWGSSVGNSWRISSDVSDSWSSVSGIAASFADIWNFAGPGGFNDFDMLEIGNGGLTTEEERAHFGLWAISKSPLLIGTNLATISNASLAILLNKAVIAINQDSFGVAATTFQPSGQAAPVSGTLYPYWSGVLSDGYVIGLVAANGAATLSVSFSDVPGLGAGTYSWTEAYTGATGTGTSVSATLALHDMAIFHVKKSGTVASSTSAASVTSTSKTSTTTTSTSSVKVTTTTAKSTTTTTKSTTTISSVATTSTAGSGTTIPEWGQCAGTGWTGSGTCEFGLSLILNCWS
jgi:Alpha galactosidase A/Alpha galactosidase C-terminal beta sandwich domain